MDASAQKPRILYPPVPSTVKSKSLAPIFEKQNPLVETTTSTPVKNQSNKQSNQQPIAPHKPSTYEDLTKAGLGWARVTFDLQPEYDKDAPLWK
jgi:hypothetical protein